ncbi:hypothetical protein [Ammoniphilus sp. YIM 78166]|nr:hypothetical protein [Ammoniphilus sp. YIM 78166]
MIEVLDSCIGCNVELAPWERNRSECLDCRERVLETYGDDDVEEEA